MKYWLRMGGPSGITFRAWILVAPVSVAFTWVVAPEGYKDEPNIWIGLLIGALAHLVTGAVLALGKYTMLRNTARKSRPITTLAVFFLAGAARGYSVAYLFEIFEVVETADYADRVLAGGILILIWFAISAVMVDGERQYKASYEELANKLETQKQIRTKQEEIFRKAQDNLLSEIKTTLTDALRAGKTTGEISNSVDELVRPLARRIAGATHTSTEAIKLPPRMIRLAPVLKTAFSATAYSPLWTILMSVLATLYSKLWQFGISAVIDSALNAFAIWLIFSLARRLRLYGVWVIPIWMLTGLTASSITAIVIGNFTLENLPNILYLSVNLIVPAAIVAAIGAFDRNTETNLAELREIANRVSWDVASLEQRSFVEHQRIARFVHSELQSRIRAFAMRLDVSGRSPTSEEIAELRDQCEAAFPLVEKQRMFEDYLAEAQELWVGVSEIKTQISDEARAVLSFDSYAASALEEICKEAILNAVRHGKAKRIEIKLEVSRFSETQMVLDLEVIDDGDFQEPKESGMGLSQIDQLSIAHSLTRVSGKTHLAATVTCASTLVGQN